MPEPSMFASHQHASINDNDNNQEVAVDIREDTLDPATAQRNNIAEVEIEQQQPHKPNISIACSGGGIRAGCFTVGVIAELAERSAICNINKISAVSGGGYAAAAYANWKFFEKQRGSTTHDVKGFVDFFRHRVGYLLNFDFDRPSCRQPAGRSCTHSNNSNSNKIRNALILLCIDIPLLCVVMPLVWLVLWILSTIPPAFPFAVAMETWHMLGEQAFRYEFLLLGAVLLFLIFFVSAFRTACKNRVTGTLADMLTCLLFVYGVGFALAAMSRYGSFILDETTYSFSNALLELIVVPILIAFQLVVPLLFGGKSVTIQRLLEFLILFIIYVRVYEFTHQYINDATWDSPWFALTLLVGFSPVLSSMRHKLIPGFYRWRLQKAFYGGRDDYLGIRHTRGVTFGELAEARIEPRYICCATVNLWQYQYQSYPYDLLTFEPCLLKQDNNGKECVIGKTKITRYLLENDIEVRKLEDYPLVDLPIPEAVSLSAAAVAYSVGRIKGVNASAQWLQFLGIGLGRFVKRKGKKKSWAYYLGFCTTFALTLAYGIAGLFYRRIASQVLVGVLISFVLLHPIIFNWDWGAEFVMGIPQLRSLRNLLHLCTVSPKFPSILNVSDGGHMENLGLYPLLAAEERNIAIADGTQDEKRKCEDLFFVLTVARQRLGCSFFSFHPERAQERQSTSSAAAAAAAATAGDPREIGPSASQGIEAEPVLTDVEHDLFLFQTNEPYRRFTRFYVRYKSGVIGEIMYLKPSITSPYDAPGASQPHTQQDTASKIFTRFFAAIVGKYPNTATWFQFFSPKAFNAYVYQGRKAVQEALAAGAFSLESFEERKELSEQVNQPPSSSASSSSASPKPEPDLQTTTTAAAAAAASPSSVSTSTSSEGTHYHSALATPIPATAATNYRYPSSIITDDGPTSTTPEAAPLWP